LAHPALLEARARAAAGARLDALESLDPLLAGSAGPEAEAAAREVAATWLAEEGDARRADRMRASAAPLAERVERPAVRRWIALSVTDPEARRTAIAEWLDEVESRAVDLEELVLLRRSAAAFLETGRAAEVAARLDARARWPERSTVLRERVAAIDGDGLVVVATSHGFYGVEDGAAWPLPAFVETVGAARPAGASVRWAGPDARADARSRVLAGVLAADRLHVDLGPRTLAIDLPAARPLGTGSPRVLLALGVALWGVLALALVAAVARRQRRSRELVAAREDLIAQVAHELRTPLTVLRLYGESLAAGRVPAARRPEYLRTIADESERLGAIVDRVVRVARDEDVGPPSTEARCDAVEVVRRVVRPYRAAAEDRGGRLDVDPLPDGAAARIDEDELRLVLDVVLENAVRHGGTPPRVHVGVERSGGAVVCLVEDEGSGLAREDAADTERLFERWTRGRGVKRGGAGMGLFLARRAARAAGGDVTLEPGATGGVRAVVRLRPATDGAPDPRETNGSDA
ncbi:MAG: ATP-binding protein, partial [Planctomycetota bacterium JB042]